MSKPTLKELRKSITQEQRKLLDEIWDHFLINGDWPIAWELHSPNTPCLKKSSRRITY
jgi:hypothetical protein